jgi:protein-S-isoprenylcysteine O-methyltransferase Ste14
MRMIRPSTTQSTAALWTTSLLDIFLFFAFAMIGPLWLSNWLLPYRVPLASGPRIVAAALLVFGGATWCAICVDAFVRHGRGTPLPLGAPRFLVTTGPFGVMRNPIIVGDVAILWGIALYVSTLGALLYPILFSLAELCFVVYVEEPELRARFGDTYESYCKTVPRWFPTRWPAARQL